MYLVKNDFGLKSHLRETIKSGAIITSHGVCYDLNIEKMALSDWFNGDKKPKRIGVYKRAYGYGWRAPFLENVNIIKYCRWDSNNWYRAADTVDEARDECLISPSQRLPWCGLAAKPVYKERKCDYQWINLADQSAGGEQKHG
jgi:hypothetical protein